ncbi:MAG: hypothetical protein R3325_07565 [Thermoanaerobaculia bacterium]|nr:hypothetical protein [Thermoanaerobaculia bacterium]
MPRGAVGYTFLVRRTGREAPTARRRHPLSRALSLALTAGSLAVALFHVVLLWRRLADLTLLEPWVAVRWGASALLCWGALALRRRGLSLLRGRGAVVLWLLVLLLHLQVPGPAPGSAPSAAAEMPPLLPVALGLVAAGVLAAAAGGVPGARRRPVALAGRLPRRHAPVARRRPKSPSLFSRPPPARRAS